MTKVVVGAFERLGNEGRASKMSRSTAVSSKRVALPGGSGRKTKAVAPKPSGGLQGNQGLKKLPNFG